MRLTVHDVLTRQHAAQKVLDPRAFGGPDERMAYLQTQVTGIVAELSEVLDHVGWKHWKRSTYGEVGDPWEIAKELADVLMFVMNIVVATGVSSHLLEEALEVTWSKNYERNRSGY